MSNAFFVFSCALLELFLTPFSHRLPSDCFPTALSRRFPFRVRELLAAKMVVRKFLPFSFFSSDASWAELMGTVLSTAKDTPFPALAHKRVKHLLVEMFVATKKVSGVLRPALSSFVSAFPLLYFPLVSPLVIMCFSPRYSRI